MTDYVRGANPIWYLVDLDGVQCDDNCYMWVLENTVPYIPATVYHTPSGTAWSNPIQFESNGTLPIDIFYDNETTYRLEIRKNDGTAPPSQADALLYLVEDYSPNGETAQPIDISGISTENQLSNPQFVETSLTLPYTLTGVANPDPIEIAPGWFLDLVGNGTVTIERLALTSATPTPTNAPYALRLNIGAGWTSLPVLRQRLNQNGVLWSEKYVASSLTARIEDATQLITVRMDASDGAPLKIIQTAALENDFTEFTGTALMPETTNTDTPPDAYLDFKILLPTVADIYITSLQLVTLSNDATVAYQQDSVDRQIDHLFHYYKDPLIAKPIPSYLIAWDFAFNPAQFFGATRAAQPIGANKSEYKWDQTIVFQSVESGVDVARHATSGGLTLTQAAVAAGQCAVIQYLPQTTARAILSGEATLALSGLTTKVGGITGTISIWATSEANLPTVTAGTNNSIVLTLDANGSPATQNGVWTEVTRLNHDTGLFELGTTQTDIMLSGFDISGEAIAGAATYLAVVIGFESMAQNDTVTLDWVSLCKGSLATRPAPQTVNEVTANCEYFYEKSYTNGSYAADITNVNAVTKIMGSSVISGNNSGWKGWPFELQFRALKRTTNPTINVYSPSAGTVSLVDATTTTINQDQTSSATINISNWTATFKGDKNVTYIPNTNIAGPAIVGSADSDSNIPYGYIDFHYVADARLGVVN